VSAVKFQQAIIIGEPHDAIGSLGDIPHLRAGPENLPGEIHYRWYSQIYPLGICELRME
jgi:hypothetical protein